MRKSKSSDVLVTMLVGDTKVNGYQRSRSFFDCGLRQFKFQNFNFFFSETIRSVKIEFHMKVMGARK